MEDLLATVVTVFCSTMSCKLLLKRFQFAEIELRDSSDLQFVSAKHWFTAAKSITVLLNETVRLRGIKQICRLTINVLSENTEKRHSLNQMTVADSSIYVGSSVCF